MGNLKGHKIFAISILLVQFIVFFSLFGKIRNIIFNYSISDSTSIIYILLIFALVLVVLLFVLTILLTYKKEALETNLLKDDTAFESTQKDKTKGVKNDKEEILDFENYSKKILPKEDVKLDLIKYTEKVLSNIAKEFDIVQGLFFVKEKESEIFNIAGKYAYFGEKDPKSFRIGESLTGQAAKNKVILNLKDIPENYITILSGLGSSSPNYLLIIPIILNSETIGIIELASFKEFKSNFNSLFEKISEQIGKVLVKY